MGTLNLSQLVLRKTANQSFGTSYAPVTWNVADVDIAGSTGYLTWSGSTITFEDHGIFEVTYKMPEAAISYDDLAVVTQIKQNGVVLNRSYSNFGTHSALPRRDNHHKVLVEVSRGDTLTVEVKSFVGGGSSGSIGGTGDVRTTLSIRKLGDPLGIYQYGLASISGTATTSASGIVTRGFVAPAAGDAEVTGSAVVTLNSYGNSAGDANASSSAKVTYRGTGNAGGEAFASATVALVKSSSVSATAALTTSTDSSFTTGTPQPSISRSFSEGLSELTPSDSYQVGMAGDDSVNNRLKLSGAFNLELVLSYCGCPYYFHGPADPGASPIQLGYRKGDKVKLYGPVGGEPNDGKEFTLIGLTVAGLEVLETMAYPDATEYNFVLARRTA